MSKKMRFLLILLTLGIGGIFLYPTINWYFLTSEDDRALASSSNEEIRNRVLQEARDIVSQLRDLNSQDPDQLLPEELSFLQEQAQENYRLARRADASVVIPTEWSIRNVVRSFQDLRELQTFLENHLSEQIMDRKNIKVGILQLGLDLSGGMSVVLRADLEALEAQRGSLSDEDREEAIRRALEILTSRIDAFGVTEPQIRREPGGDRIFLDIPGDVDPERVNSFLRGRGSMGFYLKDDALTARVNQLFNTGIYTPVDLLELPEDLLEEDTQVFPVFTKDRFDVDVFQGYSVLRTANTEEVRQYVDGIHLESAEVSRDQTTNRPQVNFSLDGQGAQYFFELTQEYEGQTVALVLDGRVRTEARISEPISGGSVRLTGFTQDESYEISRMLRTGSLPVQLEVLSSQAIGASLGADAIQAGIRAIGLGFVLVIVFMLVYYKQAGLVANVALLLNLFFMLAILSVFNMTLTLTSIAGLILTVGMAVDSNVIIFERIKEEVRQGKSAAAAVKAGFEKAFWTIMDANVTTLIAALFLSQLGSGPIQGFAVTLAVGIFSSLFTAIFVSRFLFDFGMDTFRSEKLSISWRL